MSKYLKVETKGLNSLLKNFNETIRLVNDFRPVLRMILGKYGERYSDENRYKIIPNIGRFFVEKVSPTNRPWAELKESTLKRKQKKWPGRPSLIASGEMFRALQSKTGNTVFVLDKRRMVFGIDGTKLPYAKFHVVGTKYMPPRVYIGFTRKQRTAIKIIIAQWIKETMRGNDPVKSRGSRK